MDIYPDFFAALSRLESGLPKSTSCYKMAEPANPERSAPMTELFQTNRGIFYFVYGQAFFVLGLAVALQSRRHSQLGLARHLWLLATFGILHGLYEWGTVFIPLQQTYLQAGVVDLLRVLQLGLEAVSFLALFQFGIELIALAPPHRGKLRSLPVLALFVWLAGVSILEALSAQSFVEFFDIADSVTRYLLGVPGGIAAALGLWQQAQQVRRMNIPRIADYLGGSSLAFGLYAVLSAIVPPGDFFPATVLNYSSVLRAIGIPVPVFRAACGILIAYLIIRAMEIFDVETDRFLEEAAQARAVAADRERIGRELHDGIIQSLFAAGLTLEDAALTVGESPAHAQSRIGEVIDSLNRTIRDIRSYILDLRSHADTGDWQTDLGELVRAFRLHTLIETDFRVEGTRRDGLPTDVSRQILAITREALTNVKKHAQATRVEVTLAYRPEGMELEVRDNGIGLSPGDQAATTAGGEHQGMRNMQERATMMGARFKIGSAEPHGTVARLCVPYAKV
jgi:signal transduction histidine kinase